MTEPLEHRKAYFTFDEEAHREFGECLWYFGMTTRTPGPLTQRHVEAIIDIAPDGTLAGVELIDNMPPLVSAADVKFAQFHAAVDDAVAKAILPTPPTVAEGE